MGLLELEQMESPFSLLFTDNAEYYYKYSPVASQSIHVRDLRHLVYF